MATFDKKNLGLTIGQAKSKRIFDLTFSFIGISLFWWIILLAWVLASIDTRSNGFFLQIRVGLNGKLFKVIKIKTMRNLLTYNSNITIRGDDRITKLGYFFRKTKVDESPQLFNILLGNMSFVGPRPDVPGYADKLTGRDRIILTIRPGITGPASIKYRNEENILAKKDNPEWHNNFVIWPDKVKINIEYIKYWSLEKDIRYIVQTVFK